MEVIDNTRMVLSRLFEDNLEIGGLKCEFMLERVELLGHVIDEGVLYP